MKFSDFGLSEEILNSIKNRGFETPSEIQIKAIPLILAGKDVMGKAPTGTGKTLAYAAGILSKIQKQRKTKVLILVPTRELAIQESDEFAIVGNDHTRLAVYGGTRITDQIRSLKAGIEVVVGTPGRVKDLIKRKVLKVDELECLVIDEFDEMLNMGFVDEIDEIVNYTNSDRQTLLMSATAKPNIRALAKNFLKDDFEYVEVKDSTVSSSQVEEFFVKVNGKYKLESLIRVLDNMKFNKVMIFCNTKNKCNVVYGQMLARGYKACVIHGDIEQKDRIKTLDSFKNNVFDIMIATDVASRGVHVDNIDLVVNFDIPDEFERYVHRVGRTGRANNKGMALNIITTSEGRVFLGLCKFLKAQMTELQIPTKEVIVESKYVDCLAEVNQNEEAIEFIRDYNKSELMALASDLLYKMANQNIHANFNKDINYKADFKSNRRTSDRSVRLFINVGTRDKLKKGSLLDLIKEKTGLNKDYFTNIEVLTKFSFLDVDKKVEKEFCKKIETIKIGDYRLHAEQANKR